MKNDVRTHTHTHTHTHTVLLFIVQYHHRFTQGLQLLLLHVCTLASCTWASDRESWWLSAVANGWRQIRVPLERWGRTGTRHQGTGSSRTLPAARNLVWNCTAKVKESLHTSSYTRLCPSPLAPTWPVAPVAPTAKYHFVIRYLILTL